MSAIRTHAQARVAAVSRRIQSAVEEQRRAVLMWLADCFGELKIKRKEVRIQNFKTLHKFTVWRDKAMHVVLTRQRMMTATMCCCTRSRPHHPYFLIHVSVCAALSDPHLPQYSRFQTADPPKGGGVPEHVVIPR